MNFDKSTIFFSSNTMESTRTHISRELGVRYSNNPEKYLGLPNMIGRQKKASFQNLKDRMKKKVDGWATQFLSQGRKEVFIKAILQAILVSWLVFYSLNLFVRKWKVFWLGFGSRRLMERKAYIDVLGGNCVI